MDPIAAEYRTTLLDTITPNAHLPLLLSGGVDSATLLAAQLALGHKPPCYSFRLGGRDHEDVRVARLMTDHYQLPFTVVEIDRSRETLEADVRELIDLTKRSRRTIIMCAHPILYMARRIHTDGHTGAIVGTGAVCLDDRKVHQIWSSKGEDAAREYREAKLDDRYTDCGTGWMHRVASMAGVTLEEPYSDEPLRSHALALDYAELNRPRQKGIALRAFPEFWSNGWYRRNSPLQVNSGVRAWHDTLLATDLNTRDLRDVVGIYNDILHGKV